MWSEQTDIGSKDRLPVVCVFRRRHHRIPVRLQEGTCGEHDEFHGKSGIRDQTHKLPEESQVGGLRILQHTNPLFLMGFPQRKPLAELFFRDIKPLTELFNGMKTGEVLAKNKEDEEQTIAGIGDNDIRENGVGMLTVIAEYTHNAEVFFLLLTVLKVNDGSAVVIVDVTVPGTSTDGAGLRFRLKAYHEGVKNRF